MLGKLVAQLKVDIKGTPMLKTIFLDERGSIFTSYSVPELDKTRLPDLPQVQIEVEQSVYDGKLTARAKSVRFQGL